MRRLINQHPSVLYRLLLAALPLLLVLVTYALASQARLAVNPVDKLLPGWSTIEAIIIRMGFVSDVRSGDYLLLLDTMASLQRLAIGVAGAALVGALAAVCFYFSYALAYLKVRVTSYRCLTSLYLFLSEEMNVLENLNKGIQLYIHNIFIKREHGAGGVQSEGYKSYVGGDYEVIGLALSEALINKFNLQPHDVFYDIACGSLRVGRHLIPYLDAENYCGIDGEELLVKMALEASEIDVNVLNEKLPQFSFGYDFDFSFSKKATFAFANSLFTHLNKHDIEKCLAKLFESSTPEVVFYATFSTTPVRLWQPFSSHSHRAFNYTHKEIENMARNNGWECRHVGNDWGHPRKQHLFKFTKVKCQ